MNARRSLLPVRVARASDLALLACMWVCVGNAFLARTLSGASQRAPELVALAILLLLPALQRKLFQGPSLSAGKLPRPALIAFGLQVLVAALIPSSGLADRFLILGTWLVVHIAMHRKAPVAAALLVVLTPLQALAAMAGTASAVWLVAFPVSVAVASIAVLLLSYRLTSERVERRAARAHVRAWLQVEQDTTTRARTRLRPALALGLGLLGAMALFYPLLVALPRPSFNPRSTSLDYEASNAEQRQQERAELESDGASGTQTYPGNIRPGGSLNGRLDELSYETLLTVRAFPAGGLEEPADVGPLYLRAICLDTFTETGLRSNAQARLELLADADDGRTDGWIDVEDPMRPTLMELEIRQNVLRVPGSDAAVLFSAQPVLAIDLPAVRHDPDFMLALPRDVNLGEVAFRVRVGQEPLARWQGEDLLARHPDVRFLQLPANNNDRRFIEELAHSWSRSASNDYERIASIVGHLRSNFGYTTKTTDVPGTKGIAHFLRREQGHCTSFAAAAVLMLRSLDIPSRVVTGFLAEEYDEQAQGYLVSRSNGHAWIEVHFEGLGWQPFESTSSHRRTEAMLAAREGLDDGLAEWARTLSSDFGAWARSAADEAYFDALQDTLLDGPRAALASLRRHGKWAATSILAFAMLGLLLRARRKQRKQHQRSTSHVDLDLYERWLARLATRGGTRARGMTLQEWTGSASFQLPAELAMEMPDLVKLFYRARYGDQDLDRTERLQVQDWMQRLDNSNA